MSKASQRRVSAEQQGYKDAKNSGWFRWKRYLYMAEYKKGFNRAMKELEADD